MILLFTFSWPFTYSGNSSVEFLAAGIMTYGGITTLVSKCQRICCLSYRIFSCFPISPKNEGNSSAHFHILFWLFSLGYWLGRVARLNLIIRLRLKKCKGQHLHSLTCTQVLCFLPINGDPLSHIVSDGMPILVRMSCVTIWYHFLFSNLDTGFSSNLFGEVISHCYHENLTTYFYKKFANNVHASFHEFGHKNIIICRGSAG